MRFKNRQEAGQQLAQRIKKLRGKKNLLVLAIPRGGVAVGKELAEILGCPLDVIVTKKIGAPANPELAVGAVGPIGEPVVNERLATQVGADEKYFQSQIPKLQADIKRREKRFRAGKPALNLKDKQVIITDDGVATGATMAAAVEIVRQQEPKKIIVAVPVIARDSLTKISKLADEVIYLQAPSLFLAVGRFYWDFKQVSDEEVVRLLGSGGEL